MKEYDVVVIGAGPGGYVAAIRCAQLGLETACVDAWLGPDGKPALGGTCLNVGCIPSKALLDSSHHFHNLQHLVPAHGITVENPRIDIAKMLGRKNKVVRTLTRGVAGLLKKNKVEAIHGHARFVDRTHIEVVDSQSGDSRSLSARHFIIATGSSPVEIAAAPVDGKMIVDNTGALDLAAVPGRLGVIGAGVIGLELGSVWRRLGAEVVLLEALDDFLPAADGEIAKLAARSFKKQGLDIRLGARVTEAKVTGDIVQVNYEDKGGSQSLEFDKLIVAVGRRANTQGLAPEAAGIDLDERGRVPVDAQCQTAVTGIYAIGDVVTGPMLAHKASEEGVAVAEQIAGQTAHIDHGLVPWVIYTHPEIAWVGKTEAQLEAEGVAYRCGTFPYMALGRAQGSGDTEGLVKVIGDARTDTVLGIHVYGAQASEMIGEAVVAMSFGAATEDLARTIHAHPTLAEAIHEASLAADGRAINI